MRKSKLAILPVALACALFASQANGQTCLGLPSFTNGSVHLNVSGEFPDSASAWAVGLGAGKPDNLFATLAGGQISYDGLDEKTTFGILEFGVQIPVGPVRFCPIAGGYFGAGPDDESIGLKITSRAASAGGAIGFPIALGPLTVIPNAAVLYEYLSVRFDEDGFDSITETSNSGVLDLGLGLVLGDRVGIQPILHFPFGGDETEVSFGLFLSVSFGWRAR